MHYFRYISYVKRTEISGCISTKRLQRKLKRTFLLGSADFEISLYMHDLCEISYVETNGPSRGYPEADGYQYQLLEMRVAMQCSPRAKVRSGQVDSLKKYDLSPTLL